MASTPQQSLPDGFVSSLACAICGAPALRVAHLKSFPDYVACGSCKASFVAEADGARVLYGNIPEVVPGCPRCRPTQVDDFGGGRGDRHRRAPRPISTPPPRVRAAPLRTT